MKMNFFSFISCRNKQLFVLSILFFVVTFRVQTFAQCTTGALWQSGFTPTCTGSPQVMASGQYAGEYSTVNLIAGTTYTFTSSIATDYITVATDPGNVAQVWGTQPVVFTPGVTGLYRIYIHTNAACGTQFTSRNLSVSCAAGPPVNDNPCSAIALSVGVSCVYANYTNALATASAGVPAPGCATYSGGDVWFTVTVPASGSLNFDTQTGVVLDGGMAVYSGSCASLTLLGCDDNSSANGQMPALSLTGLTPGATLWIRVWESGNNNNGTFGICVVNPNPPPNPADCPNAINVCSNTSISISPNGSGNIVEFTPGTVSNPSTNPNCCNSGCLITGEANSTWLLITIQTSGTLQFSFGAPGGFGCYDWNLYGPYNASTCSNIASNTLAPISCNWNATCQQFTGMASPLPAGGAAGDFETPLAVTAGQQYMVCFSNYSNLTTNVPINFFGTATIGCGPLPVQLQSFGCSQKGNRMSIDWVTSSEINNNYFVIERSGDGVNFDKIGQVNGNGNSNGTIQYNLNDVSPLIGTNYYRLKQVDYDGEYEIFNVSSCEFVLNQLSTVIVYNMTGQLLLSITSSDYQTDVNNLQLPVGLYLIEVSTGNDKFYQTHFHGNGSGMHWYGE